MPKGYQNGANFDAKSQAKTNAKTGSEKEHENYQTS